MTHQNVLQELPPDFATTDMRGECSQFAPEDASESLSVPNAQGSGLIPDSHRDNQDTQLLDVSSQKQKLLFCLVFVHVQCSHAHSILSPLEWDSIKR